MLTSDLILQEVPGWEYEDFSGWGFGRNIKGIRYLKMDISDEEALREMIKKVS